MAIVEASDHGLCLRPIAKQPRMTYAPIDPNSYQSFASRPLFFPQSAASAREMPLADQTIALPAIFDRLGGVVTLAETAYYWLLQLRPLIISGRCRNLAAPADNNLNRFPRR